MRQGNENMKRIDRKEGPTNVRQDNNMKRNGLDNAERITNRKVSKRTKGDIETRKSEIK